LLAAISHHCAEEKPPVFSGGFILFCHSERNSCISTRIAELRKRGTLMNLSSE
jgi:hypothetical protein